MNQPIGPYLSGVILLLLSTITTTASADGCNNKSFSNWMKGVKQEATEQGISTSAIRELDTLTYNPKVIAMDRKQGVFAQTFLKFAGRMVSKYRISHGKKNIRQYANLFSQLESEYGVPAAVITAFWALETDFGANTGSFDTLRSLATLAHDCRRPELFRPQLLSALKILDKGYLSREEMKGAWAGELGQTQFLPTDYLKHGLDGDSDGRINLLTSKPDVLSSTAKHLAHYGWRKDEPWLEEVKVPAKLDWQQANLNTMLPRSTWVEWGVKGRSGELPADDLEASLLLPMGKNGPAFLAYQNFRIYTEWNKSLVYATTAAYLGTRLNGAPIVSKGRGTVAYLTLAETKQLQTILKSNGFNVGKVDGVIGANTRASVRKEQKRLGMAADGYPTQQLLRKLGGRTSEASLDF
ncbi:MAG: lytic murein transglycosylase [Gammaproteobacteria bacterium]|nr:lytic murein transglycosylase [Gammaproteobacteria bacterium]